MTDIPEKETVEQREARVREADLRMRESSRQTRQQSLFAKGFDPRTEVSADTRHIVKHLWFIFVLLPFVLGIVAAILIALEKP
jgi:hypothetical protein